jgi:hypothetical protein
VKNELKNKSGNMGLNTEQLDRIYRRTSGYCHLCHSTLARKNYGKPGQRGAWEVEHSVPRSKGGTDHPNNLYPACVGCNREKSNGSTRMARSWNGKARAPLCPEKRKQAKTEKGLIGAACGGVFGFALAGPVGASVGALVVGHLAAFENPDN